MKQKIILVITLFALFITGCSASEEESIVTTKAKTALENHEYEVVMDLLDDVLKPNDQDSEERSLYLQAMRMLNVETYENKMDYKSAIEELEKISKIKGGLSKISKEASSKKKELEKVYTEYVATQQTIRENAKQAARNGKYANKKKIEELNEKYIKEAEEAIKKEEEEKAKEEQEQKPQTPENGDQQTVPPIVNTPTPNNDTTSKTQDIVISN